jgi:hypothetical protein
MKKTLGVLLLLAAVLVSGWLVYEYVFSNTSRWVSGDIGSVGVRLWYPSEWILSGSHLESPDLQLGESPMGGEEVISGARIYVRSKNVGTEGINNLTDYYNTSDDASIMRSDRSAEDWQSFLKSMRRVSVGGVEGREYAFTYEGPSFTRIEFVKNGTFYSFALESPSESEEFYKIFKEVVDRAEVL